MATDLNLCSSNGDRVGIAGAIGEAEEKKLVIITWRDILSCSGWEKLDDVECPEFITVGWLISQDDDTIKIASTLDPTDSIGEAKGEVLPIPYGITAFPKGCVINIKHLP